ncbi:HpcH/HpaI aldolase family protein [Frigidibacter sp. ROC022]|uniref:HpcH/HpaI aldolase family protein n=1 Tax=Frigidibacter sp. ROC022 TaxID=2971796 RepID=UPI00215B351D|nr:aldolase/citrate lyase family protein [Frigidibacter sp. ROC022]MCR8726005.1 aldolase/citrate lyase family protein [Frigidibacter sp. ROC022]
MTRMPRSLQKGLAFRQKLRTGQIVSGAWSTLGSPEIAYGMARAGLDYVLVDLEHGKGGIDGLSAQVQALAGLDTAIMVRLPEHGAGDIKRILDAGANALLAPQVNAAAEAAGIIEASLFPPEGRRGVAVGSIAAADWGYEPESYFANANEALTILTQVETPQAVETLPEVLALSRLDGIFVGPNDLSAAMGMFRDYDNPAFRDAFAQVMERTLAAGKVFGALPFPGMEPARLFAGGAQVVTGGADMALVRAGAQAIVAQAEECRRTKGKG